MRELENIQGFIAGGQNMNNILFADDTSLIASSRKKLQQLLDKVAEESKKKDLSINYNKTVCMVICKDGNPKCELNLEGRKMEQVD